MLESHCGLLSYCSLSYFTNSSNCLDDCSSVRSLRHGFPNTYLMIIDPQKVSGKKSSNYPQQFQTYVAGRIKKKLGNVAGLKNFGVNLVTLEPGSISALRHWHTKQDEFIYILSGEATLVTNAGEQILQAGMAAGFPAGEEDGHHLLNRSDADVVYLEIGDRTSEDKVDYPDEDLIAKDKDGVWIFTHRDGRFYDS